MNWLKRVLQRKMQRTFDRGYDYAAGQLLRTGGEAYRTCKLRVDAAKRFNMNTALDDGIDKALADFERLVSKSVRSVVDTIASVTGHKE